jgi:hypothetical protein
METKKSPKIAKKYVCECCDYICSKQSEIIKHTATRKHEKMTIGNKMEIKKIAKQIFQCKKCNKKYKTNSGLWKHNNSCKGLKNENDVIKSLTSPDLLELFLTQSKENQELKNLLIDQNKIFTEMFKNNLSINNTNITNNTNSHNKTFNLQFFLNEQCKDAMNIMDFVNSVTLQLSDLEHVGQNGYVEGISNIMIRKLNEMDIHKRPLHCSDAKREILYVKDADCWEKEGPEHIKLRKAIKYISKKNSDLLTSWSDNNPSSKSIHTSENDKYMVMIQQAMGGSGEIIENENKIIRKLAKVFLIDKL